MIQYRKEIASILTQEKLTELGNENWAMCGVNGNTFFFMRPTNEFGSPNMIQKDKIDRGVKNRK